MLGPGLLALSLALAQGPMPEAPPAPATAAAADAAGNRLEPFPVRTDAPEPDAEGAMHGTARHCAGRNWCVWAEDVRGPWELFVWYNPRPDTPADPAPRLTAIEPDDGEPRDYAIWPWIVREPSGAVIVGLLETRSTTYSGGSAYATRLRLFRAAPGSRETVELADLPFRGAALIRACFFEADERNRRGACHDEYDLAGALGLDPSNASGPPAFVLETRAATFPGRVTRGEDSRDRGPLAAADLVWAADPACSYRRRLAWDAAAGRYAPDAPLPACPDYLDF